MNFTRVGAKYMTLAKFMTQLIAHVEYIKLLPPLIYCNCIKVITQQHDSIPRKMSVLLTYVAMRYNRNVAPSAL